MDRDANRDAWGAHRRQSLREKQQQRDGRARRILKEELWYRAMCSNVYGNTWVRVDGGILPASNTDPTSAYPSAEDIRQMASEWRAKGDK